MLIAAQSLELDNEKGGVSENFREEKWSFRGKNNGGFEEPYRGWEEEEKAD